MAPPRNTGFQAPRSPCTTPLVTCSKPQTLRIVSTPDTTTLTPPSRGVGTA